MSLHLFLAVGALVAGLPVDPAQQTGVDLQDASGEEYQG
jgi:hypothetical protein